ncbi:uncharacterized protein MELLADRAFT_107870 [Melampsora larici-populina 98AG31]|uniref:Rho-GAP domain-containing protein n=1 Tax=Melampsora larici-populina (strain 98AG31 / pathotype 3-4-7) TaxID=747676 RepID=F4RR72_MELLP|nr:uncharacterized protein MELLADRAFT_107870 [Melampsora larici-populina 98AG31]EGG05165.1 hypothetical protein MELLADRAFT_107870 [Melampsora larici-populina 98AG31]
MISTTSSSTSNPSRKSKISLNQFQLLHLPLSIKSKLQQQKSKSNLLSNQIQEYEDLRGSQDELSIEQSSSTTTTSTQAQLTNIKNNNNNNHHNYHHQPVDQPSSLSSSNSSSFTSFTTAASSPSQDLSSTSTPPPLIHTSSSSSSVTESQDQTQQEHHSNHTLYKDRFSKSSCSLPFTSFTYYHRQERPTQSSQHKRRSIHALTSPPTHIEHEEIQAPINKKLKSSGLGAKLHLITQRHFLAYKTSNSNLSTHSQSNSKSTLSSSGKSLLDRVPKSEKHNWISMGIGKNLAHRWHHQSPSTAPPQTPTSSAPQSSQSLFGSPRQPPSQSIHAPPPLERQAKSIDGLSNPVLPPSIKLPANILGIKVPNRRGLTFGQPLISCLEANPVLRHPSSSSSKSHTPPAALNESDRWMPAIAVRCLDYLNQSGPKEEGIYRIPGRSTDVEKLRVLFDAGCDVDLSKHTIGALDPHAVASTFKLWLRELPDSLLTRELEAETTQIVKRYIQSGHPSTESSGQSSNHDTSAEAAQVPITECVNDLSSIFKRLPAPNWYLLRAIANHLSILSQSSSTNRMTLDNLRLILSPTLKFTPVFLQVLVEHRESLFKDACPVPSSVRGPERLPHVPTSRAASSPQLSTIRSPGASILPGSSASVPRQLPSPASTAQQFLASRSPPIHNGPQDYFAFPRRPKTSAARLNQPVQLLISNGQIPTESRSSSPTVSQFLGVRSPLQGLQEYFGTNERKSKMSTTAKPDRMAPPRVAQDLISGTHDSVVQQEPMRGQTHSQTSAPIALSCLPTITPSASALQDSMSQFMVQSPPTTPLTTAMSFPTPYSPSISSRAGDSTHSHTSPHHPSFSSKANLYSSNFNTTTSFEIDHEPCGPTQHRSYKAGPSLSPDQHQRDLRSSRTPIADLYRQRSSELLNSSLSNSSLKSSYVSSASPTIPRPSTGTTGSCFFQGGAGGMKKSFHHNRKPSGASSLASHIEEYEEEEEEVTIRKEPTFPSNSPRKVVDLEKKKINRQSTMSVLGNVQWNYGANSLVSGTSQHQTNNKRKSVSDEI